MKEVPGTSKYRRLMLLVGSQCEAKAELSFLPRIQEERPELSSDRQLIFDLHGLLTAGPGEWTPVPDVEQAVRPGLLVNPTKAVADAALELALKQAHDYQATLLIYYVGHGYKYQEDPALPVEHFLQVLDTAEMPAAEEAPDNGWSPYALIGRRRKSLPRIAGVVLVVDACHASWAVNSVKGWVGVRESLRHVWFAASHDSSAYDGCLTRTVATTIRDGITPDLGLRLVSELTAGDLAPVVDQRCKGQSPLVSGYQYYDPGMYLASNRAAAAELSRLGLDEAAGALSSRLLRNYVPFALSAVVAASQTAPIVAVIGDAGTGKSTLAAALRDPPADVPDVPLDFSVHAVVFLSLGSDPATICASLARQLATIPNFARAVDRYRVSQGQQWETLDQFERSILGPLTLLGSREPLRIVIDGLDEVAGGPYQGSVVDFAARLGEAHRVIVTSRPGAELPAGSTQVYLDTPDEATARGYMTRREVSGARMLDKIWQLADGNWLVLDLASGLYRDHPGQQISDSLDGLYSQILAKARSRLDWSTQIAPVLGVLVTVEAGPVLPLQLLTRAVARHGGPASLSGVYEVLADEDLRRIITRSRPGTLFERAGTFHATVVDWLRSHQELDLAAGRSALLDGACDLLSQTTADGGNFWYELHASVGELDSYWLSLEAVAEQLDHATPAQQVRLGTLLVALRSSIRSLALGTPGPLVAAAVRHGLWSVERAVGLVDRIPDDSDRVAAMIDLAPEIPPRERSGWVARIVAMAAGRPRSATGNLGRLVQQVPEESQTIAHEIIAVLGEPTELRSPSEVTRLAPVLAGADTGRALSFLANEADPVVRAALTRAIDEPAAAAEVRALVAAAPDLMAKIWIVLAAARQDGKEVQLVLSSVIEDVLDSHSQAEEAFRTDRMALERLVEVASDQALERLGERLGPMIELITGEGMSAIGADDFITACADRPSLRTALTDAARQVSVSIFGTGALASLAAAAPDETWRIGEVADRLADELHPSVTASTLADLPQLGPVLARLPADLRDQIVGVAEIDGKLGSPERSAQALAGLAPGLTSAQVRRLADRILGALRHEQSGSDVRRPLALLAPLLDARQLESALEIAAAARDDGYEGALLGILIRHLDADTATVARRWIADRSAEHFAHRESPGRTEKQEQFVDLVASLLREQPAISDAEVRHLKELSAGLDPVPRASCLSLIASSQPDPQREELWVQVDDLVASIVADDSERATLLSGLASVATGTRQQRYVAEALRLERDLSDPYLSIRVLRLMPSTPQTSQRVLELRGETRHSKAADLFYANLASRLPPAEFDVSDLSMNLLAESSDLGWGRVSLIRRLVAAGRVATALRFVDRARQYERQCIDAVAAVLPADRIDDMLTRDPHNARVIARMMDLDLSDEALARVLDIPAGADRFMAVVRCLSAQNKVPGLFRSLLEMVVDDLQLIPYIDGLWTCLEAGAPQLARLPEPARSAALLKILALLGSRMRLQAMPGLYLLAPLIEATSGKQGVADTLQAVMKATSWWPAYPRNHPQAARSRGNHTTGARARTSTSA